MRQLTFVAFEGISLTSKIIKFFTRSNISHVAFLAYEDLNILVEPWPEDPNSITSFFKQVWRSNKLENHTSGTKYTVWALNVDDHKWQKTREFYLELARSRCGYNWWGVIGFVIPLFKETPGKYFCSEGLVEGLKQGGLIPDTIKSWKYSPDEFIELIQVLGAVQVKTDIVRGNLESQQS